MNLLAVVSRWFKPRGIKQKPDSGLSGLSCSGCVRIYWGASGASFPVRNFTPCPFRIYVHGSASNDGEYSVTGAEGRG